MSHFTYQAIYFRRWCDESVGPLWPCHALSHTEAGCYCADESRVTVLQMKYPVQYLVLEWFEVLDDGPIGVVVGPEHQTVARNAEEQQPRI